MGIEEIQYMAQLLGEGRTEVKRMVQTAILSPDKAGKIEKHMTYMVRNLGFDLSNLPIFSLSIPEEIDHDGIFIGNILFAGKDKGKLFIPTRSLDLHTIITGISGCGKSTIIKQITPQLIEKGIKVIILDNENEYKALLNWVNPENVFIIDPKDDKENFFQPPENCATKEWLSKLKNLFREVFYLRDGSMNMLSELLNTLYERAGIFAGGQNYPTLHDFIKLLEDKKFKGWSRTSGYHESLVNRFKGLEENLGETLACQKGFELEKEQSKLIIYRTSSLSDDIRNFYINLKMLREATYREKLPPQGLMTVFVIEEAHKLYNQKIASRNDMGEPMIFSNSRTFRKRGIGCIYADQVPSELPAALAGNVSNHIILRLVSSKCVWRTSQSINLNQQQADFLPVIPKRQCIFQSEDYPDPVLLEIPYQTYNFVTEEAVEEQKKNTLPKLQYTPISDNRRTITLDAQAPTSSPPKGDKPDKTWKAVLEIVLDKQPVSLADIFNRLDKVSNWQKKKIIADMESQEMIETCPVSLGTRGNPKTFVVLRQKGAEFMGMDYQKVKLKGKGDIEHVILQNLLAQAMKDSGKTVSIEYYANGKSADIAEIEEHQTTAYEIELAPSHPHVAENVRKDFGAGFSKVVIITKNKADQEGAKDSLCNKIDWDRLQRVNFMPIKDFFSNDTGKRRKQ